MDIVSEKDGLSKDKVGLPAGEEENEQKFKARKVDRELSLKGKVCPYTFVESMLALEEMKIGKVLRVIVDYPPAV